jgi:iron complex outermembrane receptor protein
MTKCKTAASLRRRSVVRVGALLMNSAIALVLPGIAHAASDTVSIAMNSNSGTDIEMVVITGRRFNPEVAPSKSSLETTEPQTIISRSYIEDSQPTTTDYVNILAIVPSMTGTDINGPGLSDGNVKNTLRGQPDGNFGISYDGVPFGDTNGPTHHSESYFPGAVIGGVQVDRGPGNAGTIGPSTFGGSIFLFSEGLTDDPHAKVEATAGSWDTYDFDANVQTGTFDNLGFDSKLMVNLLKAGSTGYLTLQSTHRDNELVKYEADLAPNWSLTLFGNWNALHQTVNDNNGATPAQITNFGINFALQNTNPALPTYAPYSHQNKITDMDYLRLRGAVTENFHIDDQAYTYAYVNKTVTTTNITQTQCDITGTTIPGVCAPGSPIPAGSSSTAEGLGTKTGGTISQVGTPANPLYFVGPNALGNNVVGGTVTGATSNKTDIPGYTKLNAYRVWGNTLRASWDYAFGQVTGQLRAGLWWEYAATQRQRFYFDVTQCFATPPCQIFKSELTGQFADSKTSKGNIISGNPIFNPNGVAGVGYYEHSNWNQYQPFLELEIHPIDDLTITPGIKYVWWRHDLSAPIISASKPPVPFLSAPPTPGPLPNTFTTSGRGAFTTTRTLPFATVNYKIEPYWSTYFQYAQGIYIPDITAFEQKGVVATFPKPQTTTNYQWGMVFYGDNFSLDGDIYYVDSNNTISFATGGTCPPGDTCATNIGAATYKGIEGESTYAFGDEELHGLLDGLSVFANGSLNSAKSGGLQLKQAPFWTAASGLIYKNHGFKLSLIDKVTGQQYSDNTHLDANGLVPGQVGYAGSSFYKLGAYNTLDFTGYYDLSECLGLDEDVEIGGGVYNILDSHKIVALTINDSASIATPLQGTSVTDIAHRPGSLDQYYFQAARSFQATIKIRW